MRCAPRLGAARALVVVDVGEVRGGGVALRLARGGVSHPLIHLLGVAAQVEVESEF